METNNFKQEDHFSVKPPEANTNIVLNYYVSDNDYVQNFLIKNNLPDHTSQINNLIKALIGDVRGRKKVLGSFDDLLQTYSLNTKEGLAIMALAEALLRIADNETALEFISEKMSEIDLSQLPQRDNLFSRSMSWGMGIAQKIIKKDDKPQGIIKSAIQKIGLPSIHAATVQMVKLMSNHFIISDTIKNALKNSDKNFLYSYDMLGESARDSKKAEEYYNLYSHAISEVQTVNHGKPLADYQSISVKLSALHPKFFPQFKDKSFNEVYEKIFLLAKQACHNNVPITIDAEEAEKLEFTLEIFTKLKKEKEFSQWNGLGLAVQSYQKRAFGIIHYLIDLSSQTNSKIPVRLVKGAYWDSEIKKAQEKGLREFPVFTRKESTDCNFLLCAKKLLDNRNFIYPQIATHNATTIAEIVQIAGNFEGWEFQRLFGMAEELYNSLSSHIPEIKHRIYAPVGNYEELLSYLVRRLLENGANSNFVNRIQDKNFAINKFLLHPKEFLSKHQDYHHPKIKMPKDIFPNRSNSMGYELGFSLDYKALEKASHTPLTYNEIIKTDYSDINSHIKEITSPIDKTILAKLYESSEATTQKALQDAEDYFDIWKKTTILERAKIFYKMADLLQERFLSLLPLLVNEAGKTIVDSISEIREAIDFCRYYASQAEKNFSVPLELPSVNGEKNSYSYKARGVFVCISPWNFPIAIFLGQISAALLMGNCVIAKPAEQTPLIAIEIIKLLREAGLPQKALCLVIGDSHIGSLLTTSDKVSGIAFTGSTEVAKIIYRTMSNSECAIRPLIAETGGLNAMIVDSTALLEQVTDDVLTSAFGSAGQRCSALRLLIIQKDISEKLIQMLMNASSEIYVGHPKDIATQMASVIDEKSYNKINNYLEKNKSKIIFNGVDSIQKRELPNGYFIAPTIIKLNDITEINEEIFAPILHIITYEKTELGNILKQLNDKGFGLTLGIHSRSKEFSDYVIAQMNVGNIYINRNMIGAVVESQPFGGYGKSGTGFKAGGPDYLKRFCYEQVITNNITALGGDTELMLLKDDG